MRSLLLSSCTAATVFATATFFAPDPAHAVSIAAPMGLGAAIQQSNVKQNVYRRRWGYYYSSPDGRDRAHQGTTMGGYYYKNGVCYYDGIPCYRRSY